MGAPTWTKAHVLNLQRFGFEMQNIERQANNHQIVISKLTK